jgi:hypothetical protein
VRNNTEHRSLSTVRIFISIPFDLMHPNRICHWGVRIIECGIMATTWAAHDCVDYNGWSCERIFVDLLSHAHAWCTRCSHGSMVGAHVKFVSCRYSRDAPPRPFQGHNLAAHNASLLSSSHVLSLTTIYSMRSQHSSFPMHAHQSLVSIVSDLFPSRAPRRSNHATEGDRPIFITRS